MIRAAKLDVTLYEEVKRDPTTAGHGALIVVIVSVATGLGVGSLSPFALITGIVSGLFGWGIWAAITYYVGTRLLPEDGAHAEWSEVARALAFAQSPGVLRILGFVPVLGNTIVVGSIIWQLAAMVVATQQALNFVSTARAIVVVLVGGIPYIIITSLIFR